MAASKPRLIRNDLVTDADLARFQHASGSDGDHDPCPVADKALFLDAMMSLIFRKRKKAPCRGPGSNRSENLNRSCRSEEFAGALQAFRAAHRIACTCFTCPGGELHLSECARSY
jgi:hypothetical protein